MHALSVICSRCSYWYYRWMHKYNLKCATKGLVRGQSTSSVAQYQSADAVGRGSDFLSTPCENFMASTPPSDQPACEWSCNYILRGPKCHMHSDVCMIFWVLLLELIREEAAYCILTKTCETVRGTGRSIDYTRCWHFFLCDFDFACG